MAQPATVLWIVRVESLVHEVASAGRIVVCDGARCATTDLADRIACEHCDTEGLVSSSGIPSLGCGASGLVLGAGTVWTAARRRGLTAVKARAQCHVCPHTAGPATAPRRRHHTGRTSTGRALLTPRVVGLATHDPQGVVVVGPGRHEEGKGKAPALGSGLRFRERQTPGIDSNRTLDHRLTV